MTGCKWDGNSIVGIGNDNSLFHQPLALYCLQIFQRFWITPYPFWELSVNLKGLGTFCTAQNTNFHKFKLNLQVQLPLKCLIRGYSVYDMSKTISRKLCLACTTDLRDSPENIALSFSFSLSKTWHLMKLKLLQVNYITSIFIHSE